MKECFTYNIFVNLKQIWLFYCSCSLKIKNKLCGFYERYDYINYINYVIVYYYYEKEIFKYLISFNKLVESLQLMNAQWNQKFSVITYNLILLKNQVAYLTNKDRGQNSTWYRAIFLYEIAIATFAQHESISTHWFRDGSLHFRYCHRSPLIALWRVLFFLMRTN